MPPGNRGGRGSSSRGGRGGSRGGRGGDRGGRGGSSRGRGGDRGGRGGPFRKSPFKKPSREDKEEGRKGKESNFASHDVLDLKEENEERSKKRMNQMQNKFNEVETYKVANLNELEDEEIDEDMAFGADDYQLEEDFNGKIYGGRKKRSYDFSSDEEEPSDKEEEEVEEEGVEYMDLSEMLDEQQQQESTKPTRKAPAKEVEFDEEDDDEEEDEEDEEEGEDDDEENEEESEIEEDDEVEFDEEEEDLLNKFSDKDEESSEEEEEGDKLSKVLEIITGKPTKKRAAPVTETREESEFNLESGPKSLNLKDVVDSLQEETSFSVLKRQMTDLNKKSAVFKPIDPVDKSKLETHIGYKNARSEAMQWSPFVQVMQNANVNKTFPLQQPIDTTIKVTQDFYPLNDMEMEINQALKEGGYLEKRQKSENELELKKLDLEQERERHREMVRMKNLLTYQDLKDRHRKKIKSKTFRRHLKRRIEKEKLSLDELKELDPERYQEEIEKAEKLRIQERATLRHAKGTGKLARGAKQFQEGTKAAIQEQMDLKRSLMQKQRSMNDSSEDEEEEERELDEIKRQLTSIGNGASDEGKHSKIFKMKFMRDAVQRELQDAERKDLDDFDEQEREEKEDTDQVLDPNVEIPLSQALMNKSSKRPSKGVPNSNGSVTKTKREATEIEFNVPEFPKESKSKEIQQSNEGIDEEDGNEKEENPWMTGKDKSRHIDTKAKARAKRAKKVKEGDVQIDANAVLTIPNKKKDSFNLQHADENQKELIKKVFNAATDYEQDYLDEINKEDERERLKAEKEQESGKLPGWGSWVGSGITPRRRRDKPEPEVKKVVPKTDAFNIKDVTNNRTYQGYKLNEVPKTFETQEQYDASLRVPLGKESNSMRFHSSAIVPEVSVKRGVFIRPVTLEDAQRIVGQEEKKQGKDKQGKTFVDRRQKQLKPFTSTDLRSVYKKPKEDSPKRLKQVK
eukprot:TRINITY_DN2425_c0_g2_i5.p1 TRINITY_DN2425_c0_g2~~TRINITY_DN2425_c0_g2_i5.p1  ORF type:complete len:966 (-),score=490.46 TRINITY_DN2425_c0_g2_i5:6-2903(-)